MGDKELIPHMPTWAKWTIAITGLTILGIAIYYYSI